MSNICRVSVNGITGEFNSDSKAYWNKQQNEAVDRIVAMSKCQYQSDLDNKESNFTMWLEACCWDKQQLISIYSVLMWFLENNWADKKKWLEHVIRNLTNKTREKLQALQPKNKNNKKETKSNPVKTDVKAPIAKKTAEVNEEFPAFAEASFPDTSKDLFTEMLSKGSKMPKM